MSSPCWFGGAKVVLISKLAFVISIRRTPAYRKNLNQNQPGNEAANVRGVGDASGLRPAAQHSQSADQLEHEPKADREESRHGRGKPAQQHDHPVRWIQKNVPAQD